jgi:hypothetical protein
MRALLLLTLLPMLAIAEGVQPLPPLRIDAGPFKASEADIRKVCESAALELIRHFPEKHKLEPILLKRGEHGPIVLFNRNDRGEIVLRLDTGETYWSQYAYQYAHEFCHVLCDYDEDASQNLWFEETLCETASLFAMRAMARTWKDNPPYPNWTDYRDSLRAYADDVVNKRTHLAELTRLGLPRFYTRHQDTLSRNATQRELNGAMAVALLPLFEADPSRWEALRWLNSSPSPKTETFPQYLSKWHQAAPARHKEFTKVIADQFGFGKPAAQD